MKYAFLISGLVEFLGGLVCYLYPDLLYEQGPSYMMSLYALSAMVLGIINLVVFFFYEESKLSKFIFIAMMFFHGAVAMMTYGTQSDQLTFRIPATISHLVLFCIFLLTYMKDLKPEN